MLVAVLGLVTTVVVAWGCEINPGRARPQRHVGLTEDVNRTLRLAKPLPRRSHNGWEAYTGFGTLLAEPYQLSPFSADERFRAVHVCGDLTIRRMGWPMYALESRVMAEPASFPWLSRRWALPPGEIFRRV